MTINKADIVSLAGLSLAGASIPIAIFGYIEPAIRILFIAYLMDILDGWIARRLGEASQQGFMLDRAIDRVSQVIAPLIIYLSWVPKENAIHLALLTVYSSIIITTAFYRLIYRGVRSLEYFSGLPMFFHAGILIMSSIIKYNINPLILVIGSILSLLPVRYFRRIPREGRTPSPAVSLRASIVLIMAIIPYNITMVELVARSLIYILIVYMITGPIIYWYVERVTRKS
ncbi:MAG: CDP-alcohol phosphatidyltransferase family protein [Desulfurococcales archaeon]|nr:CDP-alcohol phosphatidyltransferase family protein [Desulfurococcales archaeon]